MPKRNTVTQKLRNANNPATIASFMEFMSAPNPARFRVGDGITFEKMDPREWPLLILDIRGNDIDIMCWDGNPHLVRLKRSDLEALRIIRIEEFGFETVNMHRKLVGLPVEEAAQ